MSEDVKLLSSHIGSTNIVSRDKINSIMGDVIKTIGSLLEDHCGPYGSYAMIPPDSTNILAEPTFTKDGINIINATMFLNPIEIYTKDMMSYIGKKVEQKAGDGTTSSMLISAKLIYAFREYLITHTDINYRDFLNAYELFISNITTALENIAIFTDKNDIELIKSISYHQAMTSSHGDVELSNLVSELYSSLPQHAWRHLIYKKESRETKDRFKLVVDESSYSAEAYIFDNLMLNSAIGTEFSAKDVELIVTSGELVCNCFEFDRLLVKIQERTAEDKHLVIITQYNNDKIVMDKLTTLFHAKRKEGISFTIFRIQCLHPTINDIEALYATTGYFRNKMNDQEIVFSNNIDIEYKNSTVFIYGLINYNEDGTHPDVHIATSPVNILLNNIEEFLSINKSNNNNFKMSNVPSLAKNIVNNIKCMKQGYVMIGGNGYDNRSSADVLIDVLSAVRESLTSGVALGGYKSLAKAITMCYCGNEKYSDTYLINNKLKLEKLEKDIGNIFLTAICEMLTLIYVDRCPHAFDKTLTYSTTDMVNMYSHSFDVITGTITEFTKDNLLLNNNSNPIITQPKVTDTEFIKRFGEVAIKFLFTNRVLIPNGVFVNEKNNTEQK